MRVGFLRRTGASSRARERVGALRIVLVYVVVAGLWILLSDIAVARLAPLTHDNHVFQTVKGLLYVGLTAALLFVLVRRHVAAIAQGRRRLESTLDSMPDGVVAVSADGRNAWLNPMACHLLEVADKDEPCTLQELSSRLPRSHPDLTEVLRRALQGETVPGMELVLARDDARPGRQLRVSAGPVRDGTDLLMAVVVLHDVSELKRLQRLREEFLATAAHELKTPIAAIKGYVQMLRRWAPEGHEPREKAAFDVINRQCDRITRLVQELLTVSRLQLGELQMHREPVDLCAIARDVVGRMQIGARHPLRLVCDGAAQVEGDPDRLEEVLVNLVDNAMRFSPEGTEIEARIDNSGDQVLVSVSDHGVGIPADREAQVFEPFSQAHAGTDVQHQGGIGVGLHLSRQIIERHGGRIWFESQTHKGSTFHFSLPAALGRTDEQRP